MHFYSKIGFQKVRTLMVRGWLHELEPANHLKNLGHLDRCVFFLRTQSQNTYVVGEMLRTRGDRRPGWGRKPHLIQYLLEMIGKAAEIILQYYSTKRFLFSKLSHPCSKHFRVS